MTIYLVSAGSYSDYHVVGLFSDKERAEQLASQEDGSVEEYLLDDPKWNEQLIKHSANAKGWVARLDLVGGERAKNAPSLSGEEFRIRRHELSYCFDGKQVDFIDYASFADQNYWKGSWSMHVCVIAETEEKATKIAKGRFDAFIAHREKEGKPLPRGKSNV